MKRFLIAVASLFLLTTPASAQCPDVVSYVKDLLSEEPAAQRPSNEPCMLALFAQDKTFFDREVLPRVEKLLKSEDPALRTGASAVPMMMTYFRHDSGEVLSSFLPVLIEHIDDPANKVRQNTLITVAKILGQTASPPDDVLDALISTAKGGVETSRAFYALA